MFKFLANNLAWLYTPRNPQKLAFVKALRNTPSRHETVGC